MIQEADSKYKKVHLLTWNYNEMDDKVVFTFKS